MNDTEFLRMLGHFPTGNLCNAAPEVRAMRSDLTPLYEGAQLVGPAKTVKISQGDNAAIHRAVHTAKSGEVLVVEGGGDKSFGYFGDILAAACQLKGIRGLVIDGTVRDIAEIRKLQFPVFSLGSCPMSTSKCDYGEIDGEIVCGDLRVSPGDLIVADDDGVVVIPKAKTKQVIGLTQKIADTEERIKERLAAGETTCEIFCIEW